MKNVKSALTIAAVAAVVFATPSFALENFQYEEQEVEGGGSSRSLSTEEEATPYSFGFEDEDSSAEINLDDGSFNVSVNGDSMEIDADDMKVAGGALAAAGGLMAALMLPAIIFSVVAIVAYWKLFTKAGIPGWHSIIPILNLIDMAKIAGLPAWIVIGLLLPFVNIVVSAFILYKTAIAFGKSSGFAVATVFLAPIMLCIIAFSKDCVYNVPAPMKAPAGFSANVSFNNGAQAQPNQAAQPGQAAPTAQPEQPAPANKPEQPQA